MASLVTMSFPRHHCQAIFEFKRGLKASRARWRISHHLDCAQHISGETAKGYVQSWYFSSECVSIWHSLSAFVGLKHDLDSNYNIVRGAFQLPYFLANERNTDPANEGPYRTLCNNRAKSWHDYYKVFYMALHSQDLCYVHSRGNTEVENWPKNTTLKSMQIFRGM